MTKVVSIIISSFLLFEITSCETLTNMVNCSTQFSNLCLSKDYDITEPAMKPLTVKAKIVLEVSKKLDLSGSMLCLDRQNYLNYVKHLPNFSKAHLVVKLSNHRVILTKPNLSR
jgi:hypothetical protein